MTGTSRFQISQHFSQQEHMSGDWRGAQPTCGPHPQAVVSVCRGKSKSIWGVHHVDIDQNAFY